MKSERRRKNLETIGITLTKYSGFSEQNLEIEETFQSTTYVSFPTKTELINKNMGKKERK